MPCRAQSADDHQLMTRGDTGKNRRFHDRTKALFLAQPVQLSACQNPVPFMPDAGLCSDCAGSQLMVTSDHHRTDSSLTAEPHRLPYLFSGRVNHSGQTEKGHPLLSILSCRFSVRQGPNSCCKHPQAGRRHLFGCGGDLPAQFLVKRHDLTTPSGYDCTGAADNHSRLCKTAAVLRPPLTITDIRLRMESNGTSPTRRYSSASVRRSNPTPAAAVQRAVSVGSPV